jgi:hypothetical protein
MILQVREEFNSKRIDAKIFGKKSLRIGMNGQNSPWRTHEIAGTIR